MKDPQVLRFNEEKNTFYRVNKNTGVSVLTYANGQSKPSFKPNVTGVSFIRQEVQDPNFYSLKHSTKSRSKSPIAKNELVRKQSNMRTLEPYDVKKKAIMTNSRAFQTLMATSRSRITSLSFKTSDMGSSMRQSQTDSVEKQKAFLQTARHFTSIKEARIRDNHSPKNQLDATSPSKYPFEVQNLTMTNFNVDHHKTICAEESKAKSPKTARQLKLPRQFQTYDQYLKEKTLFYRFRPDLVPKEDPRLREKQKTRKRNLIHLEKLFIRANDKKSKTSFFI